MILRTTLAVQVAKAIQEEIKQGGLGASLPSEQALCNQFGISRTTLRRALAILRRDGVVETNNGIGSRVVGSHTERLTSNTVGLLEPEAVGELKPYQVLWIDELKSLLMRAGYELVLHRARHPKTLERATKCHSHACWILSHCSAAVQQWFERRRIRCMVAGISEGVSLPSVSLDNAALGRHAAGQLLAKGHRHVVALVEKEATAAWVRCLEGFADALQSRGASLKILKHGPKAESTIPLLAGLFECDQRPTAIFVLNPFHYLTVMSFLQQRRLTVPGDISLITTYGDPFLNFVVPRPCCYDYRPAQYARAACRTVMSLVTPNAEPVSGHRTLIPAFRSGASLANLRGDESANQQPHKDASRGDSLFK